MVSLVTTGQAQGFSRPIVISLLNILIEALGKHESAQNLVLDPATGALPNLATTINQPVYDLSDNTVWPFDGIWRVSCVYTKDALASDYDDYETLDYGAEYDQPVNTSVSVNINGNWYYPYYQVQSRDAVLDADGNMSGPILTFTRQPGTTTTKYFIQGYRIHNRITSERQPIPLPDSDGAHLRIVFPCLTKLIEARNNGNYDEAMEYINMKRIELYGIIDKGTQGKQHRVIPRPY